MAMLNFIIIHMTALVSIVMAAPTAIDQVNNLNATTTHGGDGTVICGQAHREWDDEEDIWMNFECTRSQTGAESPWTLMYNEICAT